MSFLDDMVTLKKIRAPAALIISFPLFFCHIVEKVSFAAEFPLQKLGG